MLWNPELVEELIMHGWDRETLGQSQISYPNQKFRHLRMGYPVPSNGAFTTVNGTRTRLYVEVPEKYLSHLETKIRSTTIDISKPNWRKRIFKWVVSACMVLTDTVWRKEDEDSAKELRITRERISILNTILRPTGVTAEEFTRKIPVGWKCKADGERQEINSVSSLRLTPRGMIWDAPTQVEKYARVLLFLHQEGWFDLSQPSET